MKYVSMSPCRLLLAGMAAGALFRASPGLAQESASASAAPSQASTDGSVLKEVVVTAQKRSQDIQSVPISITALSSDQLAQAGINSTQDLVNSVPGLHWDHVGDTTLPSIRGITTFPTTAGVENTVALYLDDVYIPDTAVATMDLQDVSSVDVLKGPQGTLFGRNATAGAIQIFTADPNLTSVGGKVGASYGNFDDETTSALLTGPLVPGKLGLSLSGYQETANSYYHNLTPNASIPKTDNYTVRGKILYTPTDDTRILLTAMFAEHADASSMLYEPYDGITPAKTVPGAIYPTQPWQLAANLPLPDKTSNDLVSAEVQQQTSVGEIKVLGAWSESQLLSNTTTGSGASYPAPYTGTNYFSHARVTSYQAEVDFLSRKFGNFSFVSGADYYKSKNVWNPDSATIDVPGEDVSLAIFGGQTTSSYAVFGEGTYELTDKLSLVAGVRDNEDDRAVIGQFVFGSIPATGSYPTWESHDWNSVTQKVSLLYEVTPATHAYFTYSTGFQSGNFDNTTIPINTTPEQCAAENAASAGSCPLPNLVRPETVTHFELGFKSTPTPWLRVDAALYDDTLSNMQIQTYSQPTAGSAVEGKLSNAATTSEMGTELNVDARVTDALIIRGGISLLNATFTSYENASWNVPAPGGDGLVATPVQSADGKEVPRAPKATLNLAATYTRDLSAGVLSFTVNGYASERIYLDVGNVFYQPAYATLGLRASFSPERIPDLNVSLWGNNLTDRAVILGSFLDTGAGANVSYQAPRTYGVTLDYKF